MNKDINAIGIVRQMIADGQVSQEVAEKYFPELAESEDERIRKEIISYIKSSGAVTNKKWIAWLEKQGEQKPAWSEEDERCLSNAIDACKQMYDEDYDYSQSYIDAINWLKSLRPQNKWKPSDEQMKILNEVLNFAANHESLHWNNYIFGTLNNLIRQLKKLR